jgi:hypothetical protein
MKFRMKADSMPSRASLRAGLRSCISPRSLRFASNSEKLLALTLIGNAPLGTKAVVGSRAISREVTMNGSRDQNRIQPVDPDLAIGAIGRLFAEIREKFALVPNLFRVLASAPATPEGLTGLSAAYANGSTASGGFTREEGWTF